MPAFDTSALVPLFDSGHPRHEEAQRLFQDADVVLLHPCVLQETTTVVRRNAKDHGTDGNKAARTALRQLLAQPRVRIACDVDHGAAVERFLAEPAFSFTDAVVAAAGRETPVTFDAAMLHALERGQAKGAKSAASRFPPSP